MKKERFYVSEHFMRPSQGHKNYAFVDVNLRRDNELFIDPALVETNTDEWSKDANRYLQSFMDKLNEAFRSDDQGLKQYLFSQAREQNAIKLGYGRKPNNGRGNTDSGLAYKFNGLSKWAKEIGPLSVVDVAILVKDFAEDGMSDWLAHILAKPLAEFTQEQCKLYGQDEFSERTLVYWSPDTCRWESAKFTLPTYNAHLLLLVPKQIVRKHLITSPAHFLRHAILKREKENTRYVDKKGKVKYRKSKKDLVAQIPKDANGGNTRYINNYIEQHPDIFGQYHDDLPGLCVGKRMTDSELDEELYQS